MPSGAGERIFGYLSGAETLPQGAWEAYSILTNRSGKGTGSYEAWDMSLELEHGVTDRFSVFGEIKGQSIDTSDIIIGGYIPENKNSDDVSGVGIGAYYNILKPAADDIGLTLKYSLDYSWVDRHSGQDKDTLSVEFDLITQKYFMEGQLVWLSNLGLEATWADRGEIPGLPASVEWVTDPEMEIELKAGSGLSYRIAPNWFIGAEAFFETEFETEVGQERWSWFAGPSVHYADRNVWVTLTWLPQIIGGGEKYDGQKSDLHLIEKTKNEYRLTVGFEF